MASIDPLTREIRSVLKQVKFELDEIEQNLTQEQLEASVTQDLDSLLAEYDDVLKTRHHSDFDPNTFKKQHFQQLKSKKEFSLNKAKGKLLSLQRQMLASLDDTSNVTNKSFSESYNNGSTCSCNMP